MAAAMDGFVQAFFAIDKSHKEWLSTEELIGYMKENDLDDAFVETWQLLFDPEKTGKISLSTFCEVLGLQEETVREQFNSEEMKHVELIECDMDQRLQLRIIRLVNKGLASFPSDDKELVRYIKQELDRTHRRLWHVIAMQGKYNSFYSYETGLNFCFKMANRVFIIYRTPDPKDFV